MPENDNIAATLRIQIQFCQKYLANHTDPSDPRNTQEIRDYLEAQLELAKKLLAAEETN
ncbi:hypothetical protein HDF17_002840 [Granulicella arctica]|uniref:Uncharacterized protein n=1 Tax=Granulicella arctica TaxID=940613 RepID=A0A7Y9PIR8_9BACT|nr:hypothetical protein [Granulicella arctica]